MVEQHSQRRVSRLLRAPVRGAPGSRPSVDLKQVYSPSRFLSGRIAAALVILLALLVRAWHLTSWDLWTDEIHTLTIASTGAYSFGPAYKLAPLNFILTHWAIGAFGVTELGGRIVPMVAGTLTVVMTYIVGKRWIGARAGLFAALLLAITPWHVFWSQNARHFSLATLFVLLSIHSFLLFWKADKKVGLVLLAVCVALALSVHSSTAFYLAGLLAFVFGSWAVRTFRHHARGAALLDRRHALALGALGAVLTAYIPISLIVGRYIAGNNVAWNPLWNLIGSLVFYIPPYLSLTALAGALFLWRERDDLGALLLMLVIVPVILVALASRVTIASSSYVLASIVPVVLLAGAAMDRLLMRTAADRAALPTAFIVAGVGAALLFELALYHTKYHGLKPRWREASEYLRLHRAPGDVVVAAEADVVRHYLGQGDVRWHDAVDKQAAQGKFPPKNATGIWYVVYTADDALVPDDQAARRRVVGAKELKYLLPLNYGPKDRTLGLFFEPIAPAAP